jgi:hypothetical protein
MARQTERDRKRSFERVFAYEESRKRSFERVLAKEKIEGDYNPRGRDAPKVRS